MMSESKILKTIGILGGMGPEATADLFHHIIRLTPAATDADHIPIIIYNQPGIPDRSDYILSRGPTPVPQLIDGAKKLEEWGADFIAIPCNTAHYFLPDIGPQVKIPILDMISETAHYARLWYPRYVFGLLSTLGTYKTGLYPRAFNAEGMTMIIPDVFYQEQVMDCIYGQNGLKSGDYNEPRKQIRAAIRHLQQLGANGLVSGCTELSLVLPRMDLDMPVLNPTEILARSAVRMAGKNID
jgi:aspartate racemase